MQLPDFSSARVLIVGDIMLDRYWSGVTARISPEAPVPVVKVQGDEDRPGGAANVALNAAALGAKVTLIGMTGKDHSAELLRKKLNVMSVQCTFIEVPDIDTITKLRVMSRNQQLIRLDFEQDISALDKSDLDAAVEQALDNVDVLVISDYAKGTLSNVQKLIQLANNMNVPVVVDPKGQDFSKYAGATLLTPNMSEFEQVVGQCDSEQIIVDKAHQLCQQYSLDALLVTRSEKGMTLIHKDRDELHMPAKAREVYDVTGAGDTVISTLACSLATGSTLPVACGLANAAASVVVGKLGTSTVTATELAQAVRFDQRVDRGVMTQQQLMLAVQQAKAAGETVVMTNGCFDILHAGHVSYLQQAATLGDRLIVAVNTDASVTKLKGEGRPINSAERRMAVLAGLAAVDWVVPFSEDTPERLISELLPDILVKGGDYKVEDIAGGKQVIANGGEVRVLNFEDGVSTTGIIKQIVEQN
ncbi:bifunctional D-glycero-beta-D-manno-heptose-7-phosphate kinase/D-glycero-beta-D-manno-heptose 1-phosphate adenylyltransferase HldE [Aestuariibacter salexigens]|uniref:bifunctional D-glycero-beta-D-manno-heptose-7-phosphate kinase/D-glycero-beta-D-manno-heptose 1-phosphate adenylyltransferase HldE n=1 Tax=Aestuariibacter salexigens TaxID=226010 RepID=UPI000420D886|nr:bifunctional D-glycero-beta-D-manno-heptose-7-phosphate kinase/D-glycero-beta-D-manno-heptose 1-phosphate adenylyltransferase HldE [Aestuariibacter salexigens]